MAGAMPRCPAGVLQSRAGRGGSQSPWRTNDGRRLSRAHRVEGRGPDCNSRDNAERAGIAGRVCMHDAAGGLSMAERQATDSSERLQSGARLSKLILSYFHRASSP